MHVLSELRNPLFDAPDRHRAIRALQLSRLLKEQNQTRPWQAVKSMIDRLISEEGSSRPRGSDSSSLIFSNAAQSASTLPVNGVPSYPQPITNFPKVESPQPMLAPVLEPQQPQVCPQFQTTEQPNFHWNDINFDNIIGDTQASSELPEFDFVSMVNIWIDIADGVQGFWGDPINFGSEPVNFPMDGQYPTTWTG